MKNVLAVLIFIKSISVAASQHVTVRSWGLQLSPVKFCEVEFQPSEIYLPDYGSIAVKNTKAFMFRSDLNIYFSRQTNRFLLEYGLGLGTSEYSMNSSAISSPNFLSQQSIIISNYTLRPSVHVGYVLLGRRSLHVLARAGTYYNLLSFNRDYNYFNWLMKLAFRDQISMNLFGTPLVVDLNDDYNIPRTTISGGLQFKLHRIAVGLCYDYAGKALELIREDRPFLVKEVKQARLEFTFVFGNKYTDK